MILNSNFTEVDLMEGFTEVCESALFTEDLFSDINKALMEASIGMTVADETIKMMDKVLEAGVEEGEVDKAPKKTIGAALSGYAEKAEQVFENIKKNVIQFIENAKKAIGDFFDFNSKFIKNNRDRILEGAKKLGNQKIEGVPNYNYVAGAQFVSKVCSSADTSLNAVTEIKGKFLSAMGCSEFTDVTKKCRDAFLPASGSGVEHKYSNVSSLMSFVENRRNVLKSLDESKASLTKACDKSKSRLKSFKSSSNKEGIAKSLQEAKSVTSCAVSCVGVQVSMVKEIAGKYVSVMRKVCGSEKASEKDAKKTEKVQGKAEKLFDKEQDRIKAEEEKKGASGPEPKSSLKDKIAGNEKIVNLKERIAKKKASKEVTKEALELILESDAEVEAAMEFIFEQTEEAPVVEDDMDIDGVLESLSESLSGEEEVIEESADQIESEIDAIIESMDSLDAEYKKAVLESDLGSEEEIAATEEEVEEESLTENFVDMLAEFM